MGWRSRAVLNRVLRVLTACRRLAAGCKRRPTAAICDAQSVRAGPQHGPRGYDANKKIRGSKRVPMVDAQGDPLGVWVVSADVQDCHALRALAPDLDLHPFLLPVRPAGGTAPLAFSPPAVSRPSWSARPAAGASRSSQGAGS
jgi:Transposase DDE domain